MKSQNNSQSPISNKSKSVSPKNSNKKSSNNSPSSAVRNKSSSKSQKVEDFRKAFEKHFSKPAFDIPVKYYAHD